MREERRVLYVTDRWDAPYRYRCAHAVTQLRDDGIVANVLHVDDARLLDAIPAHGALVLFRLPWSTRVGHILARARAHEVRCVFDVDDLVFDPSLLDLLGFLRRKSAGVRWEYARTFARLRRTLESCDAFVGSTAALADHARTMGAVADVHPNVVHPSYQRIGRCAGHVATRVPRLAYLSGSDTHDRDLAMVAPVLARTLVEHPGVDLLIGGFVALPPALEPFTNRVVRLPYLDWRVYPWALARCRVMIAPLADHNAFADAKSPLKFFEAGALGVPTIATPTASMRDAITDGVDGWLAEDPDAWSRALREALDPARAAAAGAAARKTVERRFSFASHRGRLGALLAPTPRATPHPLPLLPVEPTRHLGTSQRAYMRWRAHHVRAARALARDIVPTPAPAPCELRHPPLSLHAPIDPARATALVARVERDGPASAAGDASPVVVLEPATTWQLDHDLRRANGQAFELTGDDPAMLGPITRIASKDWRYLLVRMRSDAPSHTATAQLFWNTDGTTHFTEPASVRWAIEVDGEPHTYVIDLARTSWRHTPIITRLRFDPSDGPGTLEIERMALVADLAQLDPERPETAMVDRWARGLGIRTRDGRTWTLVRRRADPWGEPSAPVVEVSIGTFAATTSALPIAHGALDVVDLGPVVADPTAIASAVATLRSGGHLLTVAGGTIPPGMALAETDGTTRVSTRTAITPSRSPLAPLDIVVPVYGALEETRACLASVRTNATGDWRLVVVDDASPDPAIRAYLDQLAAADPRVVLLRNPENLGFVGAANRGMHHGPGRDVLLLNSDTVIAAEAIDRLRATAYADGATGLVSPLSNNATICSVPEFPAGGPLPPGHTVASFADLIARASLGQRPELVTGHGFCLYIRRTVLDRCGVFDTDAFGRGYGEENDLCERAHAAGYTIRLADDAFVFHVGEASFGSAATRALKERNYGVLEARHPGYFTRVARFVEANPLADVHARVGWALARPTADTGALLVLLHASFDDPGGGTEHHVRDLLAGLALPRAVVAAPLPDGLHVTEVFAGDLTRTVRYRFPLDQAPERFALSRPDIEQALDTVIRAFRVRAVHVHHLLHWPLRLRAVFERAGVPYVFTSHDYHAVCPSLNLIDVGTSTLCCAAATPPGPTSCLAHLHAALGLPAPTDATRMRQEHRDAFADLLEGATHVVFPSTSARDLVGRVHTLLPARTAVIPHGYASMPRRTARRQDGPLRVAILGAIAHPTKGADRYLAVMTKLRGAAIAWHAFGDSTAFGFHDRLRATGATIREHGAYDRSTVGRQLIDAGIDVVLLLSIWPETFSYTLSEALAVGIPAIVTDLGALGDRVRDGGCGLAVADTTEAVAQLERLVRDPVALERLQQAAAEFAHPSIATMAEAHRRLLAPLLDDQARPTPLTAEERGTLARAWASARSAIPVIPPPPPLPHYRRWWYPIYARLAPLVPVRLRQAARQRVAARHWHPAPGSS